MLLSEGADPNTCRIDGASPVWIAAQMGHDHIVRLLLKNGARVDAVRCVSTIYADSTFVFISVRALINLYLGAGWCDTAI